jgi:deoxyribodipyrimidine photolyase-related protein
VEAFLIFPHQLFQNLDALKTARKVFLVEEHLFFRQFAFHQQKIVLHRASMQHYLHFLNQNKIEATYIESTNTLSDVRQLLVELSAKGFNNILCYDPCDNWLSKRLQAGPLPLTTIPSPSFLNEAQTQLPVRKDGSIIQTDWYVSQRKLRNLLMDNGKPVGGKWTFDADNRLRYPKNQTPPALSFPKSNVFNQEAIAYTNTHFGGNPGIPNQHFNYPCNHEDAKAWLNDFLQTRFHAFGPYEDAMVQNEHWLHHSVLTPMLNTGLLTPQQIIDAAIDYAFENQVPLPSLEGFVRQIVGWREFMRLYYVHYGSKQRNSNFWGFTRKIPASFYTGNTGIAPVDNCIKKLLTTGYNHHIERLMVLGNFMLLCEFDPNEVYRWFMEMYIDAYDWVMVPNVYGMSQFADGGSMTSKPYISGSNYLLKMSDYKADGQWEKIWDGLFWRFMHVHRDFFGSNPRLGMLLKTLDRMPPEKFNELMHSANNFLQQMDHEA